MDISQEKEALRKTMREKRTKIAGEAKSDMDAAICAQLLARSDIVSDDSPVAVYLASPREIDLSLFIEKMLAKGVMIVAPRWNGKTYEMAKLESLNPSSLRRGPMGILEPENAEIIPPECIRAWIVPGLAFTRDGRRLGYGGGWYDRLLGAAPPDAVKLGVAYPFQILPSIPCEETDIMLSDVVHPIAWRGLL